MRYIKKMAVTLVLVFAITITFCNSSYAVESSYSSTATKTVNGYTYNYYSYIQRYSTNLCARVCATANRTVPAGYIGTRARMYTSSGALKQAADWVYNASSLVGQDTYIYVNVSSGYYYSKGQVRFYNGNGYTTYTSNASPNMSLSSGRSLMTVSVNENGELYGSEIYSDAIGVNVDLILAIGENNVEGYVKATDLDCDTVKMPSDVGQPLCVDRTIPLYDCNGETIIGTFIIQNNEPLNIM